MYERSQGYLKVAELRKVPIYLHWSFPVGGILISLFVGFQLEQTAYFIVGYVILVLVHEFGHVAAAKFLRLDIYSVEISGVGGLCRVETPRSSRGALLFYSGGLLAQLGLLVLVAIYLSLFGNPPTLFLNCLVLIFTLVNVFLIIANVIPERLTENLATDGYSIWKLVRQMRRRNA